nr:ATP-binding cassette sub-family C member 3-like [Dermacentor andersoni]
MPFPVSSVADFVPLLTLWQFHCQTLRPGSDPIVDRGWGMVEEKLGLASVFGAAAVTSSLEQLWIKAWTDASTTDPKMVALSRHMWVGGLIGLCILDETRNKGAPLLQITSQSTEVKLESQGAAPVMEQYADLFTEGLGLIKGPPARLHIKDGATPRFCKEEAEQEDEAQIVLTLDQWDQPAMPLKELKALAVADEVLSQVRKYTREVGFRLAGGALLAATARKLSHSLHRAMLAGVLRSPVSFFDVCPRGRLLNRFTSDLDYVDAECFVCGKQSVQGALLTATKVAIVATQAPLVVAVTVVVGALAAYGINLAIRASHTCRFFESVATSRQFQHMTETLDALSSVRAYGVAERFRCHFYRLTDTVVRGYSAYCGCYRFTRTLSATGAFVVLMAALLLSITGSAPPDPSSLGLTLSAASSVSCLGCSESLSYVVQ